MATLDSYFRDFLADIRPTANQKKEMQTGHSTLRQRLRDDQNLKSIYVSDFLQGSYRRSTAIRPNSGSRSDVDVIVVTNLDEKTVPPQEALERFRPFVKKHYPDKYRFQGRSIAIELSYVDLDLVVTSAPSEVAQEALKSKAVLTSDGPEDVGDWRLNSFWVPSDQRGELGAQSLLYKAAQQAEWKTEPLLIPDRKADLWELTNPLEQIRWTFQKNADTNKHYVNVVKTLKWWRKEKHPIPKHPKGYPLEHIIGDCCPDDIDAVALGVVLTLETIRDRFQLNAVLKSTPNLPDRDPSLGQSVLKRIDGEDFATFHEQVTPAATLARAAYDEIDVAKSAQLWRELFGSKFPEKPGGKNSGGFTERSSVSLPTRTDFG